VRAGETLGVVGESGSGKTTLGLALTAADLVAGPIVFIGKDIAGLFVQAEMRPSAQAHMQVVFQDPFGSLSPRMSVGDIIAEGLKVHERAVLRKGTRDVARRQGARGSRPRSGDPLALSA
jgi:microcin C transport system ATP-binding protein